jgi:hypothetical protein
MCTRVVYTMHRNVCRNNRDNRDHPVLRCTKRSITGYHSLRQTLVIDRIKVDGKWLKSPHTAHRFIHKTLLFQLEYNLRQYVRLIQALSPRTIAKTNLHLLNEISRSTIAQSLFHCWRLLSEVILNESAHVIHPSTHKVQYFYRPCCQSCAPSLDEDIPRKPTAKQQIQELTTNWKLECESR